MGRDDRTGEQAPHVAGPIRRRAAILAVVIVAVTAVALAVVWRATEPAEIGHARSAAGDGTTGAPPSAALAVPAPALPPGSGIAAPPEWRAEHPTVPVPVANEPSPIAGPPPAGVPTNPAEREDAILAHRRKRYAEQMERLNRRAVQRGGTPGDAGARPPATVPPPGSAASRRGALSDAP